MLVDLTPVAEAAPLGAEPEWAGLLLGCPFAFAPPSPFT
jgi:hypothetical protein